MGGMHGRAYLSRDKYRQQRSSVMGIPVAPGDGQRDPHTRFTALVSSDENVIDSSLEDLAAQPSDLRKTYGQPDPRGAQCTSEAVKAETIAAFVSKLPVSPVVLPAHVVNGMNTIFEQAARLKGNDRYQVRLDMDAEAPKTASPHRKKHGLLNRKT